MYNKKQNEKPLFAEVKSCDDEVRQQATNKDYKKHQDARTVYPHKSVGHGENLSITCRPQILPVHAASGYAKAVPGAAGQLHKLLPEEWEDA